MSSKYTIIASMKKVVCNDDRNLPQGAIISEGVEYMVIDDSINQHEERVYTLVGVQNKGITKLGMQWFGFKASRFSEVVSSEISIEEEEYQTA